MEISMNGEKFEPNGRNMTFFGFAGELAIFNHVFLETGRDLEANRAYGGFVWCDEPAFAWLCQFILENEYPMHLNLPEVPDSDVAAWHEKHVHDLDEIESLPEEWSNGS